MKKPRSQLVLLQYQVERLLSRKSLKFGFTVTVAEEHDDAKAEKKQPSTEHRVSLLQKKD